MRLMFLLMNALKTLLVIFVVDFYRATLYMLANNQGKFKRPHVCSSHAGIVSIKAAKHTQTTAHDSPGTVVI